MIDLRSDTFTLPTEEMRKVMANAIVGDDVFAEDPTVNELQDYTANLLGKEAALYVPSGVMANQIGIAVNTCPGDEIIVEADSHVFYYETAAPSIISRVQMRCISSEFGEMSPKEVESAIRPDIYYFPKTSLICLENTHNRHGGTVISIDNMRNLSEIAKKHSINLHCDGARIWNASVAENIPVAEYAKYSDTISVCMSKGLGAPVGSVLAGTKEKIEKALKWRKIIGGGMRQAGIIAAGALYAIQNNIGKIEYSHSIAKQFAVSLSESEYLDVNLEKCRTNIVMFTIPEQIDESQFEKECGLMGVKIIPFGNKKIRAVFHFQILEKDALIAAEIIKKIIKSMIYNS